MGLADSLLELADRLATSTSSEFDQAILRRAVSTAYYALFHLLAEDLANLWLGGSDASRQGIRRALAHTAMKEVSNAFSQNTWEDWSGHRVLVPPDLRGVAEAFVALQRARHEADYNTGPTWTQLDATSQVDQAKMAFHQWQAVRIEPIAQEYLLSLLVGKKRRS